jgi:hypothetical protein
MYASTAEQGRRARVPALAERPYGEGHDYLLGGAARNAASREGAEKAVNEAWEL